MLNSEKPTKRFCALNKALNEDASLSHIKKLGTDGIYRDYVNSDELNTDLVNFYKNIYCNIPNKTLSLNEFLPDYVIDQPEIQARKLNEQDYNEFNTPITLRELTEALKQTKNNTSPGIDGYTYAALKLLWPLVGPCIAQGFESMVEQGIFYPSLRTASIKLIPKKGDKRLINNWRPISLISNITKVYTKAFCNRLKKIIDKLTSNSQKAYSTKKVINETLVNILQCMKLSNDEQKELAMILIDFKKAFDSVSHVYLIELLTFFNISPHMIKIFKTMLNGKMAGIQTSDGLTEIFMILVGVAQGDSPSGLIFLLALEPLLWKIKYSNEIEKITFNNNNSLSDASFADDVTLLIRGTPRNISNIKDILRDFKNLSGLETNYEKTSILTLNCPTLPPHIISEIGYTPVTQATILGFKVSTVSDMNVLNFERIVTKIENQIDFWNKLFLSLPGRINIAKTFMLSQIGYLAALINFSHTQINTLRQMIGTFIKGKLKITFNKIFARTENEGLGMIDIKPYIEGLRLGLFKRHINNDDFWATEIRLKRVTANYPFHFYMNNLNESPCNMLIRTAHSFANLFWAQDGNILDARICFSDLLKVNINQKLTLMHFRDNLPIVSKEKILSLCLKHLINLATGTMASWQTINNICGFELNDLERFHVRALVQRARTEFSKNLNLETSQLSNFFSLIKKGSKKYRKIISIERICLHFNRGLRKRMQFSTLAQPLPSTLRDCNFYNFLKRGFLSNEFREFLFKFNTGTLYTNAMISKFVVEQQPECSRCVGGRLLPAPKETLPHIFNYCPMIANILTELNRLISNNSLSLPDLMNIVWLGAPEKLTYNTFKTSLIVMATNYFIYKSRKNPGMANINNYKAFLTTSLPAVFYDLFNDS